MQLFSDPFTDLQLLPVTNAPGSNLSTVQNGNWHPKQLKSRLLTYQSTSAIEHATSFKIANGVLTVTATPTGLFAEGDKVTLLYPADKPIDLREIISIIITDNQLPSIGFQLVLEISDGKKVGTVPAIYNGSLIYFVLSTIDSYIDLHRVQALGFVLTKTDSLEHPMSAVLFGAIYSVGCQCRCERKKE